MLKLYFFLLGTILASFAGLAAFRLGAGQSPWSPGRSYCDHCQHQLAPWQLIPICGYLLQGGRCRYCQTPLPIFYPLSELLTGGAALVLCHTLSPYSAGILLVLTSLVFLASTDYFYQFIYPAALIGLFPLGLLFRAACPGGWWPALVLFAILLLFVLLFRSLGWGDLEFLTVLLLTLGWYPTALVLLTACLLTIIVSFLTPSPRHDRVPFMPELAFATGIIMLVMSPA